MSSQKPDTATIGRWVRILDPDIGEETIHLVTLEEELPEKGKFAETSPFAQAMLGSKPGDKVSYKMPNGMTDKVEVLDIGWDR